MFDVIIVGAGPAGLRAALILGRCRRRALVCDAGRPRNAASHALHGFLTRDRIEPAAFLRIGREQLGSAIQCATKRRDEMSGKLHDLYRQVVSRWGVASGGCKPEVKELPLKGTRETRCRPSRGGAWLRRNMASPNEVSFDLRENYPLSRNMLHSQE